MLERTPTPEQLIEQAADVVRESLDELVKGMATALTTLKSKVEEVEAERDELRDRLKGWDDEVEAEQAEATEALEAVRDWMHDVMFLQKGMSDPRRILRIVERALDP